MLYLKVSEQWNYLILHLYYKLLYWSDSQTKQVTSMKPALVSLVVFTCFPKRYVAPQKKSSNTGLFVCVQVYSVCDSPLSHTEVHRVLPRIYERDRICTLPQVLLSLCQLQPKVRDTLVWSQVLNIWQQGRHSREGRDSTASAESNTTEFSWD